MPAGRPSKYSPAYVEEVVSFCAQGYSITAFAGEIGVARDTITEWCKEHPEFSAAVNRAKAKRARWWEDRGRRVAEQGGSGGQATMVIFGLKNHAPEDFRDRTQHEVSGPDGGPVPGYIVVPEKAKSVLEWTERAQQDLQGKRSGDLNPDPKPSF